MSTDRLATKDPLVGRLFAGRFQIERRIGQGGMGNIYRAMQTDMRRPVALKLLLPDLGSDKEMLGRFDREMKATTRIEHPNTVRVYEYGKHEDQFFIAMELLEGVPLSDAITAAAPFAPERVAHIGMQIAQALAAAHSEKIVHRDLKPENVMLVDRYGQHDVVKVLDFGLSRFMDGGEDDDGSPGLTQTGVRVGTPEYMAPEYVGSFNFDHRSDLYALGVLLYEMAVGEPPFTGRPYEVLEKHVDQPAPRAKTARPEVPAWLDVVIASLLEKKPTDRPKSAMEVFHSLDRGRAAILSDADVTVPPRTPLPVAGVAPKAPPGLTTFDDVTSPPVQMSALAAKARRSKTPAAMSSGENGPMPLSAGFLPASRVATAPAAEPIHQPSNAGYGLIAVGCVGMTVVTLAVSGALVVLAAMIGWGV